MAHAQKHSPIPGEDHVEPRLITKEADQFAFGTVGVIAVVGLIVGAAVGALIGLVFVTVDPFDVNPWITLACFVLGGFIVGGVFAGLQMAGPFDHK
jgi:hypothetical protein